MQAIYVIKLYYDYSIQMKYNIIENLHSLSTIFVVDKKGIPGIFTFIPNNSLNTKKGPTTRLAPGTISGEGSPATMVPNQCKSN